MVNTSKIQLKKKLTENLGFSEKKAQIYLSLLELGEVTASQVAKSASIKRTTVYNILPELVSDGLVRSVKHQKQEIYFIEDVRDLKFRLEEKTKIIDSIIPDLDALHKITTSHPQVVFFEGEGGMRKLYQDVVNELRPGDTYRMVVGTQNFKDILPHESIDDYIKQRIKKNVRIQIISEASEVALEWQRSQAQDLREVRFLKDIKNHFHADMKIYNNKVAFVSYKENFLGVVIESDEISKLQTALFDKVWQEIKT